MADRTDLRIVVITGGSRGIGAAVARRVASQGLVPAILYRSDTPSADALVREIETLGQSAMAIRADVCDEPAIIEAFETVAARGALVGLVNSAGINGGKMRIEAFDVERLNTTFAVNITGTMLCCREAVRLMARSKGHSGGAIVNISSMAATIGGRAALSHYAASKAAVDAFTVGAAKELAGEGIRVFSLRPGATVTDMTSEMRGQPRQLAEVERTIACGRLASADEIAAPVVALLSEDMAYLSGAQIDASGGGLVF